MSVRAKHEISPVNLRAMRALAGRWLPGMLATDGRHRVRVKAGARSGVLDGFGPGAVDFRHRTGEGWAPDLDDPATVGAFQQVVWETLAEVGMAVYWVSYHERGVQMVAGKSEGQKETFDGGSYAAALLLVLEAATIRRP